MDERASGVRPQHPSVPRGAAHLQPVAPAIKPSVDRFPRTPAEWSEFAELPAEARSAAYLRSIRTMAVFFTVLTIIGIIATVILLVIGISAARNATTVTTNPFS